MIKFDVLLSGPKFCVLLVQILIKVYKTEALAIVQLFLRVHASRLMTLREIIALDVLCVSGCRFSFTILVVSGMITSGFGQLI